MAYWALVMPSKKLADVRVETAKKKFKDKDFSREGLIEKEFSSARKSESPERKSLKLL